MVRDEYYNFFFFLRKENQSIYTCLWLEILKIDSQCPYFILFFITKKIILKDILGVVE